MNRKPFSPRVLLALMAVVLVLPIAITVILAVAALLTAMRDAVGGQVLRYLALGCGIVWIITMVCLVVAQSLNGLSDEPRGGDDSPGCRPPRGPQDDAGR